MRPPITLTAERELPINPPSEDPSEVVDPDTGAHVPALGPADAPTPDGLPPGEAEAEGDLGDADLLP
jgi:hypothetical protein